MKRVLVTGGHGFIGHHLVKELIDLEYDVTVIDNYKFRTPDNQTEYDSLIERRKAYIGPHHFIHTSVEDYKLEGYFDIVFHLGGYPRQHETRLNISDAIKTTGLGLSNLIKQKEQIGKLVYFSTSMVYGDFTPQTTEEAICEPLSTYGTLRLLGEELIKDNFSNALIIRPSAVYGPRDSSIRVVGKMIKDAITERKIRINGPQTELDFTFVDDVVDGTLALVQKEKTGIFNVTYSSRPPYTLFNLAQVIERELQLHVELVIRGHDNNFPLRSTLSIEKLFNETGYRPKVMLEEGIRLTIQEMVLA